MEMSWAGRGGDRGRRQRKIKSSVSVNLGLASCGDGDEIWRPLRVERVRPVTPALIRDPQQASPSLEICSIFF